jgi:hypothetical protein
VRVRDHVALSTAGAALLFPWLRGRVLWPWAASILIDADHYLWFCVQHRRLNPAAAVRYFNRAQPAQHWGTRLFHSPAVALPLVLSRSGRAAGLGMAFHVGLDAYHAARSRCGRAAALQRDGFTCRLCGTHGAHVVTHLWHQPWLLPSYRVEYFISLCPVCHEAAHARGRRPISNATVRSRGHGCDV